MRVSPFGYLRIDAYVPLPVAFRSLSRPSSAPDAKAFPLRSFQLDLLNVPPPGFPSSCQRILVLFENYAGFEILTKLLPSVFQRLPQFSSRSLSLTGFLSVALLAFFSLFSFQGAHSSFSLEARSKHSFLFQHPLAPP